MPTPRKPRITASTPPLGKLNRPRLARVLPRIRLYARLNKSANQPITWVAGPPGAGKTTLVASYAEQAAVRCFWVLLERGDSDPATFFHYVSRAIQPALAGKGAALPTPQSEDLRDLTGFTRRYVRYLAEHLTAPWLLVLDNYQELDERSPVHAALAAAISEWPVAARLIAISRTPPPTAYVRAIASQQLALIDWAALRFTVDETRGLLDLHPSDRAPDVLMAAADGWAAGLILLLASPSTPASVESSESVTANPLLFDYFASEVLDSMSPDDQAALIRLAYVPDLSASMADTLAGSSRGAVVLAALYRRNLFTARRGDTEPVYVFHALFRDFLLARGARTLTLDERRALQRLGAELLAARGQIDDAMALFIEAAAWPDVEAMVRAHAAVTVADERAHTLRGWIEALPPERHEHADNAYWLGVCAIALDPRAAQRRFERAYLSYRDASDDIGQLSAAAGAAESIVIQGAGLAALDRWIDVFEALAPVYFAIRDSATELRVLPGMLAAFVGRQTEHRLTAVLIDRAEQLLVDEPSTRQRILFATVANCFIDTGQHERIARMVRRMDRLRDATHIAPATLLRWQQMEVYWKTLAGHLDHLADDAVAIERLALTPGLERMRASTHVAAAQAFWVCADYPRAWQALELARSEMEPTRILDVAVLEFITGAVLIAERQFETALVHLRLATAHARSAGSPGRERVASFTTAVAAAWADRFDEAEAALVNARSHPSYHVCHFHRWVIAMIEAHVADRRGDRPRALMALRQGLSIARDGGYTFAPGIFATGIMPRLCALALEHDIDTPLVLRLIQARAIAPPPDAPSRWPWPIAIHTLGGFRIERVSEPVAVTRKEQRKPLDLLRLVIAHGGVGVNAKQLTQLLWPDASGDAAQNSFDNALHRMRKLIDQSGNGGSVSSASSVHLVDGGLTLDASLCWVDVRVLERTLTQTDAALKSDDDAALAPLADRILALYSGPFLAGEESYPSIIAARAALHARYLRQMTAIGARYEALLQLERAADIYRCVLEQDVLAEDLYRRLARCLIRLDRRAEAFAALRRCRENLSIILGVRPSSETETLFESLRVL